MFTNMSQQLAIGVANLLNDSGEFDDAEIEWLAQDEQNLEFEVKNALAKTGIACIVTAPTMTYQGRCSQRLAYDCQFELQIAEQPTANRFDDGIEPMTADDAIRIATSLLAGAQAQNLGAFTPSSVTHSIENGMPVTRAVFAGTFIFVILPQPGWTATGAYAGRFEFVSEDADGTKHWQGPNGMTFAIDPQTGGWSFIFKVPDVIEYNTGMIADTLPNMIIFGHDDNITEFVPDVKSQHYNWQITFEQPVHEDCMIEWTYSNIERVEGLGNLMTHHFRSEDKLVTLKVVELPSRPQQPDKDRFELQVGQEGAQSIFEVERSATEVADPYYQATLSKIEPNLT